MAELANNFPPSSSIGESTSSRRERSRERDRSDREKSHRRRSSSRESRHRSSRRRSRSRDKSKDEKDRERDKERGKEKDKEKSRHRSRSRDREKSKKSRHSRSKSWSPPPRKRKKNTLWDKPPTGFETGEVQAFPISIFDPHQNRQARRLYVGNLPTGVTDQQLAEFFNNTMKSADPSRSDDDPAVIAVQMNAEKNFAFIEFSTIEDATKGLRFNGITLNGNPLTLKRTKDYQPLPTASEAAQISHIISTNVQEGPNKIFIGGLPSYLNEEQVKELLSPFGPLKSFNLVKDSATGNSKGFAFFEYVDGDITDRACQGLNGIKLGEKTILVQRANVGAKHAMPQPNPNAKSILINPTACNFLNLQMPIAAAAALLKIDLTDPGPSTRILLLANMVSPNDLYPDEDYQDLIEDIREECSKFGTIVSMYIPRPPPPKKKETVWKGPFAVEEKEEVVVHWGVGRVYIEYKRLEEAERAQKELSGRKFNGRTVLSGYFNEERYYNKNFLPDEEEERAVAEKFKKEKERKEREEREAEARALEQEALENPGYYQ